MGLGNTKITDLTIYNDTIYASTFNGIYKKNILSSDTNWIACGMQGNHVIQTLVPDYQTFISVVEINASYTTQIYKSVNRGSSFSLMRNSISFGNTYNFLDKIAHPEGNYDTLYFLDHWLRTFDGGMTWDTLSNIIDLVNRFIIVNPENHSQIIIGGETVIFSPYLQTSMDYGDTWVRLPIMDMYFSGDNVVHDMIIDGNDWFAVGEGVIGVTSEGGDTWEQLLNLLEYPPHWGLYITDIEFSPTDKNILYATGFGNWADIIPLLYSSDRGMTWDTLSCNSANLPVGSLTYVTCLAVKSMYDHDKVFIGGKGVYKYENIITGIINPIPEDRFSTYPNPTSGKFRSTVPPDAIQVQIINMYGKVIETWNVKGETELNFELSDSGVYFVQITTSKVRKTQKVIIR